MKFHLSAYLPLWIGDFRWKPGDGLIVSKPEWERAGLSLRFWPKNMTDARIG